MKVPKFKDEKEMAEFFDTHSLADYVESMEKCDDIFIRPKLIPVSLKMDPNLIKKLKMMAKRRGISYNAYIRYLLSKGLEKEFRELAQSKV
jgi:predicted DNA binding CopG/RHH family protein